MCGRELDVSGEAPIVRARSLNAKHSNRTSRRSRLLCLARGNVVSLTTLVRAPGLARADLAIDTIRVRNNLILHGSARAVLFVVGGSIRDNHRLVAWLVLPLLVLSLPTTASAHTESGAFGGFISGFVHPLTGLDHVVAMVAVGLWGAFLGTPAIWILPVVFPVVMAVGGALGVLGVPCPALRRASPFRGSSWALWWPSPPSHR